MWFTQNSVNKIGRITMAGNVTEFPLPEDASGPWGIALGENGALWIALRSSSQIARFVPDFN
jgi:virginiamycin B lyase